MSIGGDGGGQAPCRVCGGQTRFALCAAERMLGTGERFDYRSCEACGSLQITAIPSSLERYYGDDYYTSRAPGAIHTGGVLRRRWSSFRMREGALVRRMSGRRYARFDWLRRTGTGLDDPILDVGCGSGRLLRNLARDGFTKLTGIDPRWPKDAPRNAAGPRFIRDTPESHAETHAGRYPLVMAHHSFEHMADPVAAFAAMARLLAEGGTLLLRVPVAEGFAFRHYRADWVQLDAPRHLFLPTRRTIEGLAVGAGLEVADVVDDSGPFQIWASEVHRRGYRVCEVGRGGRKVLGLRERLAARRQARQLAREGEGDQACFYLVRREATSNSDASST